MGEKKKPGDVVGNRVGVGALALAQRAVAMLPDVAAADGGLSPIGPDPRQRAGETLEALAAFFRKGGVLAYAKATGPKPPGIVEIDELVAFPNVDRATLPGKWAAWAEALVPIAYAGGLASLDVEAGCRLAGGTPEARVTLAFAEPACSPDCRCRMVPGDRGCARCHPERYKGREAYMPCSAHGGAWAPSGELEPLGVVDTRNERWRAAEARYAESQSPEDLRIISEEQAAFDRSERVAAFLGLGEAWPTPDVLRKLVEAADRLLDGRDHDGDGWEMIDMARKLGRARLAAWDAGEAASYQPAGFLSVEAEVLHLRRQRDDLQASGTRLLERARAAEGRQAAAERAAESLSRGLAGAMKALRAGELEARSSIESVGRAAMTREAIAQRIAVDAWARSLVTSEERQPTMDEARAASVRLSRARETLREKLAQHRSVGRVYLRALVVDFLEALAKTPEEAIEATVTVPGPGRVEIGVRASAGTAGLLQRILSETLPVGYSVEVKPP